MVLFGRMVLLSLLLLALLTLLTCSSTNIAELPVTEQDKQLVRGFQPEHATVQPARVALVSTTASSIDRSLHNLIQSSTRDLLHNLSGVTLVDRSHTRKIIEELRLQHSGLTGGGAAARIGEFTGASHIALSLLRDVNFRVTYHPAHYVGKTRVESYYETHVRATVEFQIIDIETTDVVFNRTLRGLYHRGTRSRPSKRNIRALVPHALNNVFTDLKPELQRVFPLQTVIIALRGDREVALIPAGKNFNIKEGMRFDVIRTFFQQTATGQKEYRQKSGELTIVHVEHDSAWGELSGDTDAIKLGMEVRSIPEEVSSWSLLGRWFNRNVTVID